MEKPDPWEYCPAPEDRYEPSDDPLGDTAIERCLSENEENCVLRCGHDVCAGETGFAGGWTNYCEPCADIEAFLDNACSGCDVGGHADYSERYYLVQCFQDYL